MSQEILPREGAPMRVTPGANGIFSILGLVAPLGAIGASSCCVVPLVLASLGAGAGVVTFLAALAPYRTPMLIVGSLAVAGGWFSWWRKKRPACEPGPSCVSPRRSRGTLATLTVLSLLMVLAFGWSYLEPTLLRYVRPLIS